MGGGFTKSPMLVHQQVFTAYGGSGGWVNMQYDPGK